MDLKKEASKARVLEAIASITESLGYPPSYRDIAETVGLAHSAVYYIVESLRADGLIYERDEAKHSRSIRLTDAGRTALGELRGAKSGTA